MFQTRVTELLGIRYPLIEGGMGEKQGVGSTVAVSNAGGLGCIRQSPFVILGEDPREVMRRELHEANSLTANPFGVNIRVGREELAFEESRQLLDLVLEERRNDPVLARKLVAIITSAGDSAPYVERIKSAGLRHIHKVSTLKQAKRAEEAGVDALIAMSQAAAGHIGSAGVDGMVLFPLIVEEVKIPVIAAGGICDGRSFVAALALGAEGVEIGTRFMATQEAGFHPNVKATVVSAGAEDTLLGVGWFSTVRIYRNKFAEEYRRKGKGLTEEELKTADPELKKELAREFFHRIKFHQMEKGEMEDCILPLGQVAGRIDRILTVEEVFHRMLHQAWEVIQYLGARFSVQFGLKEG
jgi:enoyl-[acyl-carrier protein] reductase II